MGTQCRVLKRTTTPTKVGRTETDIIEKLDEQKLASAQKQAHIFLCRTRRNWYDLKRLLCANDNMISLRSAGIISSYFCVYFL